MIIFVDNDIDDDDDDDDRTANNNRVDGISIDKDFSIIYIFIIIFLKIK